MRSETIELAIHGSRDLCGISAFAAAASWLAVAGCAQRQRSHLGGNNEQHCGRQARPSRTTLAVYWRVIFDHSPLNIFGPQSILQLNEIVTALETDDRVKVVVFDSAVEGFFITHYDFLAKLEDFDQPAVRADRLAGAS